MSDLDEQRALELAEGHLELDRHEVTRDVEQGDFIMELSIAERIALLAHGLMRKADSVSCPVCGHACKWKPAEEDSLAPRSFGGWYCHPCDVFAETDVE
jgi:hypothetical protein